MTFAFIIPILLFSQATAPKPDAPEQAVPPESKALTDARKVEDPEKRIAALRDVIRRFPKHNVSEGARHTILETTAAKFPNDTARVLAAAEDFIKRVNKGSRRSARNAAATLLLNGKTLLPKAEAYARAALNDYKRDQFFRQERKYAKQAKREEPSEAELLRRFNESRSAPLETLGLIVLEQDRVEEARPLLEQAFGYDKGRGRAAAALAALAEKDGDRRKALDLLYLAHLSGKITKEGQQSLERLHKANGGSLENLEAALDKVYREKFPAPPRADPYSGPTSGRVVLAEVFTGSGCPPCAAADLAFDMVLERYKTSEVAVVMYHQHIPRPDPMTTPATEARFKWYGRGGVPTYAIDGKAEGGGGSRHDAERIYKKINDAIEKRLVLPPKGKIQLKVSGAPGFVDVRTTVEDAPSAKLHIVLAEKELRYSGENGVRFHPMVVRGIEHFDVDLSKSSVYTHRFDIADITSKHKAHLDDYEENGRHGKMRFSAKKHEIDAKHLVVVAFLQDPETKEVLQSTYVDPNTPEVISNR